MKVKWKFPITMCVAALYLSACSSPAQNQADPLADVPPPDELRIISADASTSTCIGDPKTPLCAVETFMACFARINTTLCHQVGGTTKVYLGESARTVHYSVMKVNILTQADMTDELIGVNWWKTGFVNFILFEADKEDGSCADECRYSYIVKPAGDQWHVASWTWWGPQDPDDTGTVD